MGSAEASQPACWTDAEDMRNIESGFAGTITKQPRMHPEGEVPLYLHPSPTAAEQAQPVGFDAWWRNANLPGDPYEQQQWRATVQQAFRLGAEAMVLPLTDSGATAKPCPCIATCDTVANVR